MRQAKAEHGGVVSELLLRRPKDQKMRGHPVVWVSDLRTNSIGKEVKSDNFRCALRAQVSLRKTLYFYSERGQNRKLLRVARASLLIRGGEARDVEELEGWKEEKGRWGRRAGERMRQAKAEHGGVVSELLLRRRMDQKILTQKNPYTKILKHKFVQKILTQTSFGYPT